MEGVAVSNCSLAITSYAHPPNNIFIKYRPVFSLSVGEKPALWRQMLAVANLK